MKLMGIGVRNKLVRNKQLSNYRYDIDSTYEEERRNELYIFLDFFR